MADLRIGASVDVAAIDAGMNQATDEVRNAARRIPLYFEEAAGKTKTALNKIGADVKKNAEIVSIESLRVAEATKAYNAALADLRKALVVSKDAKIDDTTSSALLAAAQDKVAASAAALAAAKKAEAEAVAHAAEEESLSQNAVIRTFQRAAIAVRESCAEIKEQMISVAETGGLEAEGITAGFSGLSKLLGAGIAVGFATSYLDGLAKVEVELEHLSAKTGIAITTLAGLQQIAKEAGGDFETMATGLVRMESNTEKLGQHDRQLEAAFKNLGLNIEDVRRANPEELLQMISTGMAQTENANVRANSAIQIFGRGGQELVPILREQGTQLLENSKKMGALTGITEESAQQARRWTLDTARLSALFRSVMIPVLDHAEDVIRGVAGAFEAAAAVIVSVVEALGTVFTSLGRSLGNVGKLIYDAIHGNWGAVLDDARSVAGSFADEWKHAAADIAGYWKQVWHDFSGNTPLPPLPEGGDEGGVVDMPDKPGRGKKKGLTPAELIARAKTPVAEGRLPTKMPDLKDEVEAFIQANDAIVRSNQEAMKQNVAAMHEEADERDRAAQEKFRDVEQDSEFEVRMGRMTAQERLAVLRQAANEENRVRLQEIRFQEMLDQFNAQAYQRDLNRELELTRQHDRQIVQLNQQAALQSQQEWKRAVDRIGSEFNDAVLKWIQTGRGFGQSLAQIWNGIAENFIRNVLKMTEQWLIGLATQKAGNARQVVADAKLAASHTYASVSAIPVVGPILAPAAAGAAFAAVMAFDSFDQGGVVGNRMGVEGIRGKHVPILAEQGERVLDDRQSRQFDRMVNASTQPSAPAGPRINFSPTVHAYDRNGMRQVLQAHADDLISIVQTAYRDGRLSA